MITGVYESSAITGSPGPVFVPTLLTSSEYSLVTGGQRVGAQAKDGGVVFTSGLLKESTVTTAVSQVKATQVSQAHQYIGRQI